MLITRNSFSALVAATTLLTLAAAGPAYADDAGDAKSSGACWVDTDRGTTQCFAGVAEMQDAVLAQTGTVLVRQDSAAARPAGVLATYVIADLFTNLSYGGSVTSITSSSSTICASSSVSGNVPAAVNNTTSSFKSYLGCMTAIYDLTGQGGSSYGFAVNAPGVGAMNDRASSYTVT